MAAALARRSHRAGAHVVLAAPQPQATGAHGPARTDRGAALGRQHPEWRAGTRTGPLDRQRHGTAVVGRHAGPGAPTTGPTWVRSSPPTGSWSSSRGR